VRNLPEEYEFRCDGFEIEEEMDMVENWSLGLPVHQDWISTRLFMDTREEFGLTLAGLLEENTADLELVLLRQL
jgi:hypothetical protein